MRLDSPASTFNSHSKILTEEVTAFRMCTEQAVPSAEHPDASKEREATTVPASVPEAELAEPAKELASKSEPYARPLPPLPRWLQDRARDKKPKVEAAAVRGSNVEVELGQAAKELAGRSEAHARPLPASQRRLQDRARDKTPEVEAATVRSTSALEGIGRMSAPELAARRKWLPRAASVTSFVSAPAVIGFLALLLFQPPSSPRLPGPPHVGETAQTATTMPDPAVGTDPADVGALHESGMLDMPIKLVPTDPPEIGHADVPSRAELSGASGAAAGEGTVRVVSTEFAHREPMVEGVGAVATSAALSVVPLPPSQAVAAPVAELAKEQQERMHALAREQPMPPVVHQTSPGAKAPGGEVGSTTPGSVEPSPRTDVRVPEGKPVTIPGPAGVAQSPTPLGLVTTDRLVSRAESLLRQGDISAARLLLEPAVNAGGAQAAFLLAQTYDSGVLASRRVRGIAGDDTKARSLYTRAYQGGIVQARERINAMR